ncbi:FAD-binding protein, partial [Leucobacter sp. M11]|uniref:FAD-binding protein n=1 Tax=Leucobacter sp. M11 TaxID=2993565 RepID=UPI002D7E6D41
ASDGFGGKVLMERLSAALTARGITVHTDTRAQELLVAGGRVLGVRARHAEERVEYRARSGVILTTGGFADNAPMLRQHAPRLIDCGVNSDGGDDGSGILMAQRIGAAVRNMASGQVGIAAVPQLMVRGMVVDRLGRRFINEDVYPGLIGIRALMQHNLRVWIILDQEAFEEVSELDRWGTEPAFVTETVAELETELGMPEGALQHQVADYNRWAEQGTDPYFHKAARWLRPLRSPFAAVDVSQGIAPPEYGKRRGGVSAEIFTLGGLNARVDGAVLDLAGEPIPGLFAAGRAVSSMHGGGYISGTSLGDGTFFGRRAGAAAAG